MSYSYKVKVVTHPAKEMAIPFHPAGALPCFQLEPEVLRLIVRQPGDYKTVEVMKIFK